MANKTEYNAAETAYFEAYQRHIKTRTPEHARALAIRESGITPKDSWVARLKGKVDKELKGMRHAGTSQDMIDRLKGK